jgi:hypothetical protein
LQNTSEHGSVSEEPYEAAEEADHEHDLEEQPKKKKRINEVRDWIEVNSWDRTIPTKTSRCSFARSWMRLIGQPASCTFLELTKIETTSTVLFSFVAIG